MNCITRWIGFIGLMCSMSDAASAQVRLDIDHATGTLKWAGQTYESGQTINLRARNLVVGVQGTNSALFTCKLATEAVTPPEIADVQEFLGAFGKVFLNLLRTTGPGLLPETDAVLAPVKRAVEDLNQLINGPTGLHATRQEIVRRLYEQRTGAVEPALPEWVKACASGEDCRGKIIVCTQRGCRTTWPESAVRALANLRDAVNTAERKKPDADLSEHRALLASASELIELADHVDKLTLLAYHAKPTIDCGPVGIKWDQGKKVTITVEPRTEPELNRIARTEPLNFEVTMLKDWFIRPAVGVALLYAPNARYPKYGTVAKESAFQVVTTGDTDARFAYGLVLSLTARPLDGRTAGRPSLWGELTINPDDDLKSIGLGAAASWNILKLGIGALATRHTELSGQKVNDTIGHDRERGRAQHLVDLRPAQVLCQPVHHRLAAVPQVTRHGTHSKGISMCKTSGCCFIIPPHMLEGIVASSDNPDARMWALETMLISENIRGQRNANAELWLGAKTQGKSRSIYDGQGGFDLPGKLSRSEGASTGGDGTVDEAYDGFGKTYDFLAEILGRKSLDDKDMRLDGTVHHRKRFVNAFWNGRQMVFGDGDGHLFNRFTASLDVIAHELAHGVVEHTANLRYYEQPGALNESFADVIGSLVKQWSDKDQKSAEKADWLIGQELLIGMKGMALRSMKAPGTAYNHKELGGQDPQPKHMKEYQDVPYDNGGVHINSGIPNHAFYLAARAFGGYAWEKAGPIWYIALKERLNDKSDFAHAAASTVEVAGLHFGKSAANVVAEAWTAVGVPVQMPALIAAA